MVFKGRAKLILNYIHDILKYTESVELAREKMQKAMLTIKKRFGKNAVLKGMNLEEGATAKERNAQNGGHKA